MGLIVVLLGLGALSLVGLVSFAPPEVAEQLFTEGEKEFVCQGMGPIADTTAAIAYVPASPREVAAIANGDALFKSNCAQCHAVNEKVVGPALAGITKRRNISWLVPWVQNSSKVIASGDEYGVKLFNDNGKQQMPSFPSLSKKDIEDIVAWATSQNGAAPAVAYAQIVD